MNQTGLIEIFTNHLPSIAVGIAVCLCGLGFFWALGSLLPRKWKFEQGGFIYRCTFGAAIFTGCCWYSVKLAIPLNATLSYLIVISIVLGVISCILWALRFRHNKEMPEGVLGVVASFSLYYTMAYAMIPTGLFGKSLPIRFLTNNDFLHYIDYSSYLQRLGFQNVAHGDYLAEAYVVTPSAHYFLDLFSMCFGGDVMSATMPLIFGTIAALGCLVAGLSRAVFKTSFFGALCIGGVMISGVFFQYVYENGFVPQFISSVVLLSGIFQVVRFSGDAKRSWLKLVAILVVYGLTLLYAYPAMLINFLLCLGALVLLKEVVFAQPREGDGGSLTGRILGRLPRATIWWGGAVAVSMLLIAGFDPQHAYEITAGYIPNLVTASAGWQLDLLPPYLFVGLPGPLQVGTAGSFVWAAVAVASILSMIYLYVCRPFEGSSAMQKSFLVMAAMAYVAYLIFAFKMGRSYQQWKFASYFPLLWCWPALLVAAQLVRKRWFTGDQGVETKRVTAVVALIAATAVSGNYAVRCLSSIQAQTFSKNFSSLSDLDKMGEVREVYAFMNSFPASFFPIYFIKDKLIHLLSPSYYAHEEYDPDKISAATPLFWHGLNCDTFHAQKIGTIGCLLNTAPSAEFDKIYPLIAESETSPIVRADGFSVADTVAARAAVSGSRLLVYMVGDALAAHPNGYLNLHVHQHHDYVVPPSAEFHLATTTSKDNILREEQWLSIPWVAGDWIGGRVKTLVVTINLPDAPAPAGGQPVTGGPPLGLGVVEASITALPAGRLPMWAH